VNKLQLQQSRIKLVRPLSTVDNIRGYTLVYPTVDSGLTITYTTDCSVN